jgi:hypothetical protein
MAFFLRTFGISGIVVGRVSLSFDYLIQCLNIGVLGGAALEQHIGESLSGLAVVIIVSLGTLITVLTERIKRHLDTNTTLTRETKTAANGTLTSALDNLFIERNRVVELQILLREREDRIAFLLSQHPELADTKRQYTERRPLHVPPAFPDDPTGTDAG